MSNSIMMESKSLKYRLRTNDNCMMLCQNVLCLIPSPVTYICLRIRHLKSNTSIWHSCDGDMQFFFWHAVQYLNTRRYTPSFQNTATEISSSDHDPFSPHPITCNWYKLEKAESSLQWFLIQRQFALPSVLSAGVSSVVQLYIYIKKKLNWRSVILILRFKCLTC